MLADEEYKFIRDYAVTDASVHDSLPYLVVFPERAAYPDQEAFGDSAYVGEETEAELLRRGYLPMICTLYCKPRTKAQSAQRSLNCRKFLCVLRAFVRNIIYVIYDTV